MRHGETDWNRRRALQGRLNTPLNNNGILQAQNANQKLKGYTFDKVISSPLQRALTTASIVSGISVQDILVDENLIEIAFGLWEGKEMVEIGDEISNFFKHPQIYTPPQDGESFDSLLYRANNFLRTVENMYYGKCVLAVSHGAAISALLNVAFEKPLTEFWDNGKPVGNCEVIHLIFENNMWTRE